MSGDVLPFPALPITGSGDSESRATLRFRTDYSHETLSARELEALGPVLPELVAELMTVMALDSDRG